LEVVDQQRRLLQAHDCQLPPCALWALPSARRAHGDGDQALSSEDPLFPASRRTVRRTPSANADGQSAAVEPRHQTRARKACSACESVRLGVQQAVQPAAAAGARTLGAAEERGRYHSVQRSKKGRLVACNESTRCGCNGRSPPRCWSLRLPQTCHCVGPELHSHTQRLSGSIAAVCGVDTESPCMHVHARQPS